MIFAKIMLIQDFEKLGMGFKYEFPAINKDQRKLIPHKFDEKGFINYGKDFRFYPFLVLDKIWVAVLPKLENMDPVNISRLLWDFKIFVKLEDFLKNLSDGLYNKEK